VSNKNALGDWEFYWIPMSPPVYTIMTSNTTHGAKHIQKFLKKRQRVDEFMEHLGEGFMQRMIVDGGKMEIQLHLLIFG
jgi:hypothetical protein